MKLDDIERMYESALSKSKTGNGALLEAWAQFHGRNLIDMAKLVIKLRHSYDEEPHMLIYSELMKLSKKLE